jgi:hypothetical protein
LQIGLNEKERSAYSNAIESGLFEEDVVLKAMIDIFDVEVVELVEENEEQDETQVA